MRSATDRVGQVVAVPGSVPDFCMRSATDRGQVVVAPGSVPDFCMRSATDCRLNVFNIILPARIIIHFCLSICRIYQTFR